MYRITSPDFGTYFFCAQCVENEASRFDKYEFVSITKLDNNATVCCEGPNCILEQIVYGE